MVEPTSISSRVFGMYTSLCCTLVADSNIASAYMTNHHYEQRPQVSKFQKVTPLLLILTYAHSFQALTGLYAFPPNHSLELDLTSSLQDTDQRFIVTG